MNLFQMGSFELHSGVISPWKIDCDALTEQDWATLSYLARRISGPFRAVEGVPTGGLKLARRIAFFDANIDGCLLIVDDVLTTGGSMEKQRGDRDAIGIVVFARGPCPDWVTPLFQSVQGI